MILPVSNIQAKSSIKQNSEQKNKLGKLGQSETYNQLSDRFNKTQPEISFKSKAYGGQEYSDEDVLKVRKYIHLNPGQAMKAIEDDAYNALNIKNSSGLSFIARLTMGVATLGVNEIGLRKELRELAAAEAYDLKPLLMYLQEEERQKLRANEARQSELAAKRARLAEDAKKAEEANNTALAKTEYLNKLSDKQNELKTEFCEKVNLERNGSYIEKMPNVVMIEDPHNDVSKELVDYAKRNTESRFVRLESSDNDTLMDKLDEVLKKSKAHFASTKERTLIHVEGFDRLITKGQNSFENIDSLKDIMCRTASDFGSTIIFRTKDASKLVSEAIQPQRVAVRVLANFKSVR